MLGADRVLFFEYLFCQIISFMKMEIPIKFSCQLSFFTTANKFKIDKNTIRDMITRSCGVKTIAEFYECILNLTHNDDRLFDIKYRNNIPKGSYGAIKSICKEFNGINVVEENTLSNSFRKILYKFVSLTNYEKQDVIDSLLKQQSKGKHHD